MRLLAKVYLPGGVTEYSKEEIYLDSELHKTSFNNVVLVLRKSDENGEYYESYKVYDHTIFKGHIGDITVDIDTVSVLDQFEYDIIPLLVYKKGEILHTEHTVDKYWLIDLDMNYETLDDEELASIISCLRSPVENLSASNITIKRKK